MRTNLMNHCSTILPFVALTAPQSHYLRRPPPFETRQHPPSSPAWDYSGQQDFTHCLIHTRTLAGCMPHATQLPREWPIFAWFSDSTVRGHGKSLHHFVGPINTQEMAMPFLLNGSNGCTESCHLCRMGIVMLPINSGLAGSETSSTWLHVQRTYSPWGECLLGVRPACYLCIKYLISSPKFILTLGSPPSRPH